MNLKGNKSHDSKHFQTLKNHEFFKLPSSLSSQLLGNFPETLLKGEVFFPPWFLGLPTWLVEVVVSKATPREAPTPMWLGGVEEATRNPGVSKTS